MFDILFGWRKASKCKRLIRRVQCRLKILKNKRSTIVRQLRNDLSELLKNGHVQAAFDRVEQLFKDECLVAVYDLLDQFCEFIIINLSYIRRNKDCPNDINEAVSSLIFASARFGDLPELISIRKLFGERYGQRLATSAIELHPGNLVNRQIKEKVSIKSVPDDVKSRMVEEILRTSLQSGPLLLEYSSEKQQKLANESRGDPIPSAEITGEQNGHNLQETTTMDEGKIVFVGFSSINKSLRDLPPSLLSSKTMFPSTYSITVQQTLRQIEDSNVQNRDTRSVSSARKISPCESEISGFQPLERALVLYDSALAQKDHNAVVESSSEGQLPEEMICADDIQELQSPSSKEGSLQDQRIFKFRSSSIPIAGKTIIQNDEEPDQEQYDSDNEKETSRTFRKNRNISSAKRLRRRSVSVDSTSMNDIECAIYYSESHEISPNHDQKSCVKKKNQKKVPIKQQRKIYHVHEVPMHSPPSIKVRSGFNFVESNDDDHHTESGSKCNSTNKMLNICSSENPCYVCTCDEKSDWIYPLQKPKIQLKLCHCHCSCNQNPKIQEAAEKGMLQNLPRNQSEDATSPLLFSTGSDAHTSPPASNKGKPSYTRGMTMPPERPKDVGIDGMLRSNSFPFQDPAVTNRHVHPKLPDYDELAARFLALKKATLQKLEVQ